MLAGVSAKALIETVRPQPLNKDEDELARQRKYGLAPKDEDKGVRAAARAIRKKISAPEDDASHYGRLTPISYGGDTGAASFRGEDILQRAILKGTFEGTRQGVIAAFKEWVESRRQGAGGFTNANYQPGASGGMGGGGGAETPNADQGRTPLPNIALPPAVTTPHSQTPNQGAAPHVQTPATATPAAPTAPRGTTPQARRSEPSEAAAARAMREFSEAGGLGQPGQYRPQYNLGAKDLSDAVVNKIAGEAHVNDQKSVDAVIDNMLNRVGTKTYGPSGNLEEVALAAGQYAGHGHPSTKQAAYIRQRIRAIASGSVPDITNGSNEYRASWYHGRWGQKHANSPVIGGNRFAFNPKGGIGPYGPRKPGEAAARAHAVPGGINSWIEQQRGGHPDDTHHQHHRQPLGADLGRYIANSVGITSQAHKVTGDASLKISLAGFPKGTKTKAEIGGLFKTLTMYRGLAAPMADQEG